MNYAIALSILGLGCFVLANEHRGWAWLFAWVGISVMWTSIAYGLNRPGMLGKTSAGKIRNTYWPLVFPYVALNWLLWRIRAAFSTEPVFHEIMAGIYLGRRARIKELPPNITTIVDLTAELPEANRVITTKDYVCAPTLDGTPVSQAALSRLAEQIMQAQGGVYVHCALGYSRSAMVVAAAMISKGLAPNAQAAEHALKRIRSGVGLNKKQILALHEYQKSLRRTTMDDSTSH